MYHAPRFILCIFPLKHDFTFPKRTKKGIVGGHQVTFCPFKPFCWSHDPTVTWPYILANKSTLNTRSLPVQLNFSHSYIVSCWQFSLIGTVQCRDDSRWKEIWHFGSFPGHHCNSLVQLVVWIYFHGKFYLTTEDYKVQV